MPAERSLREITCDPVLGGALRIFQPRRGHRAGHDAILLAAALPESASGHLVDLGAGVGTAGLAAAMRIAKLKVTLAEIDPELVALAERNIAANRLAGRVQALRLDVTSSARQFAAAGLVAESASHAIMNPPFNATSRQKASPIAARRRAHSGHAGTLTAWIKTAQRLLKPSGSITLIWRADGLADVLAALTGAFGAIAVLPIHPRPDRPAIRLIARGLKGRRTPLIMLPGFSLQDENGRPSGAAEAVLRGGECLPFAER